MLGYVALSEAPISALGQVDVAVSVTGVSATGQEGTVTVNTTANVSVSVTGVEATGAVGTITVNAIKNVSVSVTGEQATGSVGSVTVNTTSSADYLDGIVKGDQTQVDKYIADCLAVKAKYPKP